MRFIVYGLSFIALVLFVDIPTIRAFYVSNHACPGSTQQRQCTCEKLDSDNFCDLSDSRTICGECSEPTSLPTVPPANSDLPVTSGETPVTTTPSAISPSSGATSQPPESNLPSKEEAAIYRVNQGTVPKEAIGTKPDDESLFQLLTNLPSDLLGLFQGLFTKNDPPRDKSRYYAESESLHESKLPPETKKQQPSVIDTLKGYLGVGSSAGIYSATLPFGNNDQTAVSQEMLYQKANFPEGIYPIVDPSSTPTPKVTVI